MRQYLLFTVFVMIALSGQEVGGQTIEIPSILIKLIEQVDVPAREAGVLVEVIASEGQMVEEGELLAQIMDDEIRLLQQRVEIEKNIARKKADNDVNIRFATKSAEVARAELRRASDSIEQYSGSISDSEMDRLRLTVERAVLEIEQAQQDHEIAKYTQSIKENEYLAAAAQVERRRIKAPLSGVVVQVHHHRGEWVEPGDTVMRILRIDRLRAEGVVDADAVRSDWRDMPVRLTVDLPGEPGVVFPGKVVFVSPEIDPVNKEIRVWAEIENRDLRLRPGMRASMSIELGGQGQELRGEG